MKEKITPYLERYGSSTSRSSAKRKPLYVLLPDGVKDLRVNPTTDCLFALRAFRPFEYPPLPGPDYIRLLHLEPASDDPSQLRGCLKVHKLDTKCEYEAISYTWGDRPELIRSLHMNGQILRITANLYAALMVYSYPDRVRVLWADAIYINQADAAEKTQQVSIMSDIYSKAKSV